MPKTPKVLLLLETNRATGREILYGIVRYSRLHGPWIFYNYPGEAGHFIPQIKNLKLNGIIANVEDASLAEHIKTWNVPAITKVMQIPGFPHFRADDNSIAKTAADYFLNLGIKQFGFLGIRGQAWSENRLSHYRQYLSEKGFELHYHEMARLDFKHSWEKNRIGISKWLQSLPPKTGILSVNDQAGRYAIEACKEADIKVPDTLAILGVDNDVLFCELCDPPLSSVSLSLERAGFEAAELLAQLMAGQPMTEQEILVNALQVATRRSTDILMIDDPDLAKAIRFIRDNAPRPVFVDDVVEASSLSRRVLEKRFRAKLNRSVLEEIRRVRVEKIVHFLIETSYPISKIAYEMGFPGVDHFARYFKLETGMSPLAYRQKHGPK
jgi:LacI family transcriptional regulator